MELHFSDECGGISIHALLAESDPRKNLVNGIRLIISIHALLAESDAVQIVIVKVHALFLSTLSLRRATDVIAEITEAQSISIHALLAESDRCLRMSTTAETQFLSTLSLRRATRPARCRRPARCHFYPRSPCGERLSAWRKSARLSLISIHALLAESDQRTAQNAP